VLKLIGGKCREARPKFFASNDECDDMAENNFDFIIIGGGIVGLATAMAITQRLPKRRLLVLEKEDEVGSHQTGHNSGVIHSGLYYKPGSMKAKTCVQGAAAMSEFCQANNLPYLRCGKVVVATSEAEMPHLEMLYQRGVANGVPGVTMIGPERLRELEPHCSGLKAIHVPGAGITDYAAVAKKYAEIIAQQGGEVRVQARVNHMKVGDTETIVRSAQQEFAAKYVVNCAGLHSDRVSKLAGASNGLIIAPFRGEYYDLVPAREHLVKGLIYPVPDPKFPFLGVHLTRMARGGVKAGPNAVLTLKREGYRKSDFSLRDTLTTVAFPGFWRMAGRYWRQGMAEYHRSLSKTAFLRSLQRLVPDLRDEDILPGGSGVRAQALDRQGNLLDDFQVVRTGNVIHMCNVPSPAATASIVIGRQIWEMVVNAFGVAE
jgi:L-2-hydroxyglutarate oxidase LhgO